MFVTTRSRYRDRPLFSVRLLTMATPSRRRRRAAGGGRGGNASASSYSLSSTKRSFDADADEGFISSRQQQEQQDTPRKSKRKSMGRTSEMPMASPLQSASSGVNSASNRSSGGSGSYSESGKKDDTDASGPKIPSRIRKERSTLPVSDVCADSRTIERALLEANELAGGGKLIPSMSLLRVISRASAVASDSMFGVAGADRQQVVEGIILLEEKVGDVLSVVKKCLRVATSTSSCSKTPQKKLSVVEDDREKFQSIGHDDKVAHLRLAVHCLRAACPLIASAATSSDGTSGGGSNVEKRESQMIENAIRLLYHAIVASEDVFTGTSSSSADRMDAAGLCLASCAILSHLLNGLGMACRGSFDSEKGMFATGMDMGKVQPPSPLLVALMTVPTDKLGEVGPMTAVQLAKVGAQSLLSACTILSSLFVESTVEGKSFDSETDDSNDQRLAGEFGFSLVDANVMGISTESGQMSISSFQLLVRSVAPPWLKIFVDDSSKEGVDGTLSYSKRYQRLLWEAAAQMEKIMTTITSRSNKAEGSKWNMAERKGSHFRRLVLSLRGDSILASLAMPGGVSAPHNATLPIDITSSAGLRKAILEDRLAHACECAWKSATTYAQGVVAASLSDPTWYGGLGRPDDANRADENVLVEFHQRTGGIIDVLVKARLSVRSKQYDHKALSPPISYIEYCANRAIHIGPERQRARNKAMGSHYDKENSVSGSGSIRKDHLGGSSCVHDGCIFSSFPFVFIHDQELSISSKDTAKSEEATDDFVCSSTALCVVFASLQAVNLVYAENSSDETPHELDVKIFSMFNALFLSSSDGRRRKLSMINQCQKMLAPLKLSSRAVHVGKFVDSLFSDRNVDQVTISGANLLQRVIGECYAPLLSLIASTEKKSPSTVPSNGKASRLEMAQDCYIRAAMLADQLDSWTSTPLSAASGFRMSADEALRRVYKLAVGSSDENAIMVAKSIGALGKQRIERQNMTSAIVPMLLSVEIFASVFETSCSSSYKLPIRFQQLSSLFESAGMSNEAIASLGFAIHYKLCEPIGKNDGQSKSDEINIGTTILRCVEVVGGGEGPFVVESPPGGCPESSMIVSCQFFSRLMRLYVKYYRSGNFQEEESQDASCNVPTDIIKKSRIGKTLEKAVSLESVEKCQSPLPLYRVFQLLITRSGMTGLDAIAQVSFLSRALYMFGRVLAGEVTKVQNDFGDCANKSDAVKGWITNHLSREFTGFLKLALTCISKGRGDAMSEQQCRQFESSIYLCASASFFINRTEPSTLGKGDTDLPNLTHSAIKYAEKAKSLLQEASNENGGRDNHDRLLLRVQQLAVDYYVLEVSRTSRPMHYEESSFFEDNIEEMEDIAGRLHQWQKSQNVTDINSFLAFVLARMNSEMQLMGNATLAIRAAALMTRLQHSTCVGKPASNTSSQANLPANQALAMSNLVSALSEGGFHGVCRSLLQSFLSRSYHCGRVDDFAGTLKDATTVIFSKEDISINEIDLLTSALLVQVQSSAPEYLEPGSQTLEDIIEMVREQEDCEDASAWIHVRWILSTCQMAIAQQMEKAGDVPRSLDAYKNCSRSCRSALTFIQSPVGRSSAANINPNTILHPHNIMHRLSVRLSHCLRDASSLYCRQGNYSKGEGYALSLVESMNALPDTATKSTKKGTSDLISLLEVSSVEKSVRRADALQFFVENQALSRDAAMVAFEFQDRGSNPASFVDEDVPEKALQNVRSTMSYGDIVARGTEFGGIPSFLHYHDESYSKLLQISGRRDLFDEGCLPIMDDSFNNNLKMEQFEHLMSETRLRKANRLEVDVIGTPTECEDDGNISSSSSLYRIVSESGYTSGLSRARSYYHIGLEFLADARKNGKLNQLWEGSSQFTGGKISLCDATHEGPSPISSSSSINSARESFEKAAALAGPASTLLSRQAMRCLALATGPDNGNKQVEIGYTATALVHSSVGSTQRQKVSQAFTSRSAAEAENSLHGVLFGALDAALNDRSRRNAAVQSIYDEACSTLPADWRFVALASCPTGELLASAIYFRNDNDGQKEIATETICVFPSNEQCDEVSLPLSFSKPSVYEGILKPFDDIMERSRVQLKDMDSKSLDRYSENEKKRMWWNEREAIDKQLQEVIREVEAKYFNFDALQMLLLGSSNAAQQDSDPNGGYVAAMCQGFDDSDNEEELECSLGNLADKFEAACAVRDAEAGSDLEDEDDTTKSAPATERMTVVQIKEELQRLGVNKSEFKQLRKAVLLDLLREKREQQLHERGKMRKKRLSATISPRKRSMAGASQSSISSHQEFGSGASPTCTFLILDEDLQRFPFEGFSCMEGRSICRIPSIAFAIATVIERGKRRIRADNAKYVLDPEGNLSSTKRTMLSALDSLTSKFKWTWEGVVGEIPSGDFMEAALTSDSGLFLYCGHGGGEKCFSRKQVEGLLVSSGGTCGSSASSGGRHDDSSDDECEHSLRRCSAAVLLMGCSSGRLVSVNASRTSPPKNLALEYEPEGMALSFLCAGAPCVVGNLWDVTDRDIDRFCLALLEDFLDPRGDAPKNLPQCVARARAVCKMRHIVGAAPVVYGVPVVSEKMC